jgi:hypothetical protein
MKYLFILMFSYLAQAENKQTIEIKTADDRQVEVTAKAFYEAFPQYLALVAKNISITYVPETLNNGSVIVTDLSFNFQGKKHAVSYATYATENSFGSAFCAKLGLKYVSLKQSSIKPGIEYLARFTKDLKLDSQETVVANSTLAINWISCRLATAEDEKNNY